MQEFSRFRREYIGQTLLEEDASYDPLDQFGRWFSEAVQKEKYDPNAMTLSTCDLRHQVSSRIVLMKGYSKKGFSFFGGYESKKGRQLYEVSSASLLFYWPEMIRQIRVEGTVKKLNTEESDQYFATRPRGSQIAAHAASQSQPIQDRQVLEDQYRQATQKMEGKTIEKPPHWGGWILKPHKIEFWQGRENRLHDRLEYYIDNKVWVRQRLTP